MAPHSCSLEKYLFDPFSTEDILLDDNLDPDKQFYNDSDNSYDAPYFSLNNEANDFLKQNNNDNFSILDLNITSLKKNIDSLRILLSQLNFSFKAIC